MGVALPARLGMMPHAPTLSLLALVLTFNGGLFQQGHSRTIHADYTAAPDDLAGFLAESDAVLVVQVAGKSNDHGNGDTPHTVYRVYIDEVIKADARIAGNTLDIVRLGGEGVVNGRSQHFSESGFKEFREQQSYLVFLKWLGDSGRFHLVRGPDSAFEFDASDHAETEGRSTVARLLKGTARTEVLEMVRAAAKSNGK